MLMRSSTAAKPATGDVSDRQAVEQASAILLDWDGCVMIGERMVPNAQAFIRRYADRIVILSNNSTHLPEDFAALLRQRDLPVPAERIVLAGVEALHWAAAQPGGRIVALGSAKIRSLARNMGLNLVRERPDMILLTRDTRFTYAKLARVINALQDGARLIVSNTDQTHPGAGGRMVPETGVLLAAVLAAVPAAEVVRIGKPAPAMFARACRLAGVAPGDAVMIGDNPETDGIGARNFGIRPILIGPQAGRMLGDLIDPSRPAPGIRRDQKRLIDNTSNVCRSVSVDRS
jgi:HAD superfamily hydrolase (TIGR01450 family)